ncbi:ROK family transcriptional regulator [Arthrobacter castelli]|uniref:ROK family transcriptional regulator n=1 Tax=Arthrobacter castelli TaxID=271431 RepID=UPI0004117770|nr:ROK family transcriptional regulator [Arthrobacter castelli]
MSTGVEASRRATAPTSPGRVGDVRRRNLSLILHQLGLSGQTTRARLAADTGLTKASVSSLVADLVSAGLVMEVGLNRAAERGRPGLGVALNTAAAALGLEINVDYMAAGVLNLAGDLQFHQVVEQHNAGKDPEEVLGRLTELAGQALQQAEAAGLTVHAGGLAVPGLVDTASGRVLNAPNIGWRNVDIAEWAASLVPEGILGTAVFNEANSAALAELWYGHGRGMGNYLFISGEVGIGGGIIIDSGLFAGPGGNAGEIGHIVVDPEGPECSCGGSGCLERYAGQDAVFVRAGIEGGNDAERMAALLEALEDGDEQALAAVRRAGHYLGVAASSTFRLLDIDAAVLGGNFATLERWITPAFHASVEEHAPAVLAADDVVVSGLGRQAALMGAAGSRIRTVIEHPHLLLKQH